MERISHLSAETIAGVAQDFYACTGAQLLAKYNIKHWELHAVRRYLGLQKITTRHWVPEAEAYLKRKYRATGNQEIALYLDQHYPRHDGTKWNTNHITKKMKLLKLKRTTAQIERITRINARKGKWANCATKRWDTVGRYPIGYMYYNKCAMAWFVKTSEGWVRYARYRYLQLYGSVPEGYCVGYADGNRHNITDSNLVLQGLGDRVNKCQTLLSDNWVKSMMDRFYPGMTTAPNAQQYITLYRCKLLAARELKKQV